MRRLLLLAWIWSLIALDFSTATACTDPRSPADVADRIENAKDRYFRVRFDEAMKELEAAREGMQCLSGILPLTSLVKFHVLQGLVHLELKHARLAEQSIALAVQLAPEQPFDDSYGESGRQLYETVRQNLLIRSLVTVKARALPMDVQVAVDGEMLDAGASVRDLLAGSHFVQVKQGQAGWQAHWLVLPTEPLVELQLYQGVVQVTSFMVKEASPAKDMETKNASRSLLGPAITGTFFATTVVISSLYIRDFHALRIDSCETNGNCQEVKHRAISEYALLFGSATGLVISAGFTWLVPPIEAKINSEDTFELVVGVNIRPGAAQASIRWHF